MRITFVVNRTDSELPRFTSTLLAFTAHRRGHDVSLLDLGDLTNFADGHVGGYARPAPPEPVPSTEAFLAPMQGPEAPRSRVSSAHLDVLWLRFNPSEGNVEERAIARTAFLFGRLAAQRGVLVLDDPESLLFAEGKMYLQHFPEAVRPRTIVTRTLAEVRSFWEETGQRIVLKPLDSYGGKDVYLIDRDDTNLAALMDSMCESGFVVAQEYLPAAEHGDTRLFMMNGAPLAVAGKYAAIRRVNDGHFRSNMTAGGHAEKAAVGDDILAIAGAVGPILRQDGIFLCGLDIVGDRIVELNTTSPGTLWSASRLEQADFAEAVIAAVERKLERQARAPGTLSNRELAGSDG